MRLSGHPKILNGSQFTALILVTIPNQFGDVLYSHRIPQSVLQLICLGLACWERSKLVGYQEGTRMIHVRKMVPLPCHLENIRILLNFQVCLP